MKRQSELTNVLHMGLASLWFLVTLLVGVGLSSNPAEAQPFFYVTNPTTATVSVIETNPSSPHYNKVVSTITGPGVVKVPGPPHTLNGMSSPFFIAITPDGTRAYLAPTKSPVRVIDTSDNSVVDNIKMDRGPFGGPYGPYWAAIAPSVDTDSYSAAFEKRRRKTPWQ